MTEPIPEPTTLPKPERQTNNRRNHTLLWFSMVLIFLSLSWYCLWFFYLRYYESTDDAYANGNMVNINSSVPGSVIAFYADDTDLVIEGQLIVQLDHTDYQIKYEKELATLAATVLHVQTLYDNIGTARAIVENRKAQFSKSEFDYENRAHLIDSRAISKQEFIHSRDDLNTAKASLEEAENQLKTAIDAAGNTPIENHPLLVEQKAKVRSAFYDLQHCNIYAPSTGYVAMRTVEVGQWARPSTNLMAIIPMDYLWVDANFKETQLEKMRIGQPASVWFDLYGSKHKFEGKVIGIASGTGSVFSIIPPQNATGNWIKIVQRLPVRISLDPEMIKKFPPRIGISATVSVSLDNQDLPRLANTPVQGPVAATKVYNLPMDDIEAIINKVIMENLPAKVVQNGSI